METKHYQFYENYCGLTTKKEELTTKTALVELKIM